MSDVAGQQQRAILSRSLIAGVTILDGARRSILSQSRSRNMIETPWVGPLRSRIAPFLTAFALNLAYTRAMTFVAGTAWLYSQLGRSDQDRVALPPPTPGFDWEEPPEPPSIIDTFFGDEDVSPEVRFPRLESAAQRLIDRRVLPRPVFDALTDQAKSESFTVAGTIEDDTIQTVRDVIAQNVAEGTSYKGFREAMGDRLETSFLGDHHAETVYRTNVQAAFRDGRETLMSNPVVDELFPYQEYLPIGDDRVRSEHALLGTLGLDGTGVYRRDDPFWDRFTPPWGFNCRCGVNVLTKEQAARKGVREAQRWVATGEPPARPEHRWGDIPFEPNPGFGQRGTPTLIV